MSQISFKVFAINFFMLVLHLLPHKKFLSRKKLFFSKLKLYVMCIFYYASQKSSIRSLNLFIRRPSH